MKRRDEVLVGMTATVAFVVLILGSLWLARGGLQPGYPLFAKFNWGAGLKQGQPVLLAGVNVGYVESVDIRTDGLLIVKFRIRKQYQVPLGTTATIAPNGFFGDQLIALHPGSPNPKSYQENDTILAGRPTPQIGDVLARTDTIAAHISVLTQAFNREFIEQKGFADMHATVRQATALIADLSRIAEQQSEELTKTQAAIRRATNAVDSMQIDSTIKAFRRSLASLDELAADLRKTTGNLNVTLAKVDSGPGTIGKLMNDPALYNDSRKLLARLDSLMADFQKNPRRYIKLSIF